MFSIVLGDRYWVVMVGLHNVESELTVMGDINLASVEYYTILFLPFIAAQPPLGAEFLQGSDN